MRKTTLMDMNNNQQWPCRVCGFDRGFDAWGGDENLNFSYDICACCAAEAGIDDVRLQSVRRYRKMAVQEWTSVAQTIIDLEKFAEESPELE
jgi:hypothetical protein